MIYGEILKIIHFYHFDSDPRFSPFLLYVRWKSGVTIVRKCFRDVLEKGHLAAACIRSGLTGPGRSLEVEPEKF